MCNKKSYSIKNKKKEDKKKNRANSSKALNNFVEKIKCACPKIKRSKSRINYHFIHKKSFYNSKYRYNKYNKSNNHRILAKSKSVNSLHLGKDLTIKKKETEKIIFEISKINNIEIKAQYENINKISNFNYIKDIEYQKKLNDIVRKKYTDTSSNVNSSNKGDSNIINLEENENKKPTKKNFSEASITKHKKINSDGDSSDPKSKFHNHKTFDNKKIQETDFRKNILSPCNKKKFNRKCTKKFCETNINYINEEKENDKSEDKDKNSLEKRIKKRRRPILNLVNKNISNDTIILNNPNEFYQGLFNNIIKERKEKEVKIKDNKKDNTKDS